MKSYKADHFSEETAEGQEWSEADDPRAYGWIYQDRKSYCEWPEFQQKLDTQLKPHGLELVVVECQPGEDPWMYLRVEKIT